jgi:hypothetical protein
MQRGVSKPAGVRQTKSSIAFLAVVLLMALSGCAGLRESNRSYSISYGDGKQTVAFSASFAPRTDGRLTK